MHQDDITTRLVQIPGWILEGKSLVRAFEFKDFAEALVFVNKVGTEAEKVEHHPDITIAYNKVTLTLSTHSEGGLTEKDFDLAKAINRII
ncbi:MAG: 4a-hydroxytetrahydrobiopterin dehydratase [Candidatus Pacebacteria bacterium]|nr:4a-hydroxytetrahydrobiopterin dehydratase [Candidatus Paceibacterota bacterium]